MKQIMLTVDDDLVVFYVIGVGGFLQPERTVKAVVSDVRMWSMTAGI
jgi:ATP-dependent protease HslVU (ClpYQ) peptidase subunit